MKLLSATRVIRGSYCQNWSMFFHIFGLVIVARVSSRLLLMILMMIMTLWPWCLCVQAQAWTRHRQICRVHVELTFRKSSSKCMPSGKNYTRCTGICCWLLTGTEWERVRERERERERGECGAKNRWLNANKHNWISLVFGTAHHSPNNNYNNNCRTLYFPQPLLVFISISAHPSDIQTFC